MDIFSTTKHGIRQTTSVSTTAGTWNYPLLEKHLLSSSHKGIHKVGFPDRSYGNITSKEEIDGRNENYQDIEDYHGLSLSLFVCQYDATSKDSKKQIT